MQLIIEGLPMGVLLVAYCLLGIWPAFAALSAGLGLLIRQIS